MEQKYRLTDETINHNGRTLYRIEALTDRKNAYVTGSGVQAGDLGGYIEREENLQGNAWVDDNAKVYGDAIMTDDAVVSGIAEVYGYALVGGNAKVTSHARVYGKCLRGRKRLSDG